MWKLKVRASSACCHEWCEPWGVACPTVCGAPVTPNLRRCSRWYLRSIFFGLGRRHEFRYGVRDRLSHCRHSSVCPGRVKNERRKPCSCVLAAVPLGNRGANPTRDGIPVTMLESGDAFPGGLLIRAMGRNVYRRRPPLEETHVSSDNAEAAWYRALVPGGLSNYWTGAVPRFAPEDFYEGARLHEQYRWPVAYDELVPYYERVERFMGDLGQFRRRSESSSIRGSTTSPAPYILARSGDACGGIWTGLRTSPYGRCQVLNDYTQWSGIQQLYADRSSAPALSALRPTHGCPCAAP